MPTFGVDERLLDNGSLFGGHQLLHDGLEFAGVRVKEGAARSVVAGVLDVGHRDIVVVVGTGRRGLGEADHNVVCGVVAGKGKKD